MHFLMWDDLFVSSGLTNLFCLITLVSHGAQEKRDLFLESPFRLGLVVVYWFHALCGPICYSWQGKARCMGVGNLGVHGSGSIGNAWKWFLMWTGSGSRSGYGCLYVGTQACVPGNGSLRWFFLGFQSLISFMLLCSCFPKSSHPFLFSYVRFRQCPYFWN